MLLTEIVYTNVKLITNKYKIIDILRGFEYAISLNWYDFTKFNI